MALDLRSLGMVLTSQEFSDLQVLVGWGEGAHFGAHTLAPFWLRHIVLAACLLLRAYREARSAHLPAMGGVDVGGKGAKGVKGVKGAKGVVVGGKGNDWNSKGYGKDWGKDVGKGFGKDFGKGKKGKGKRPSGPSLPRSRITEEPVTGEVVEWKGKYGWLQPTIPFEHELAEKREGKIYVSMSDLECGLTELTVGAICQFHVYSDSSGLGAEECVGS